MYMKWRLSDLQMFDASHHAISEYARPEARLNNKLDIDKSNRPIYTQVYKFCNQTLPSSLVSNPIIAGRSI
jgi:hypothetical protein